MIAKAYISSNDQSLHALSGETGGFALVEDSTPQTATYKLTDRRLELIKKRSAQFYNTICEYYAVRCKGPAQGVAIDLSDDVRAKLSPAMLVYPRRGHRLQRSRCEKPLNDLIDRNLTGFLQ
jgi:hypothetical protein